MTLVTAIAPREAVKFSEQQASRSRESDPNQPEEQP
jgi:hypothetical protein